MAQVLQGETQQNAEEKTNDGHALTQSGEEGEKREIPHPEGGGKNPLLGRHFPVRRLITVHLREEGENEGLKPESRKG